MRRAFTGLAAIALTAVVTNASAAEVIYHTGLAYNEDGKPGLDADAESVCGPGPQCLGGTKDGMECSTNADCPDAPNDVVEWRAGPIHVVAHGYTVIGSYVPASNSYKPIELRITEDAIVKFAHTCNFVGGTLSSCTPTTIGTSELGVNKESILKIDQATLTDIRDDTLGGDTNNDGSATTPIPAYGIVFNGNGRDLLFGSKVRYAREIGKLGSMVVRLNEFKQLGGLSAGYGQGGFIQPAVRGAIPLIEWNSFEILSNVAAPAAVDLRGTAAVVWGNSFTGSGTALRIGPNWEDPYYYKDPIPESGATIVTRNYIGTKNGILTDIPSNGTTNILQQVGFRATIENNVLEGTGANDGIGLRIEQNSDTVARFNSVRNYARPVLFSLSGVPFPPTVQSVARMSAIFSDNQLSVEGALPPPPELPDAYWNGLGTYIDVEHNWWGHHTGPLDISKADGLANPNGLGLTLGNGLDYKPFLGSAPASDVDSIAIEAYSLPALLETDLESAEIMVDVDYELKSADTANVTVYVKNHLGEVLNPPGTTTLVQKSGTSVEIGPIALASIPPYANWITVEAVLSPSAPDAESLASNVVPLPILLPTVSIRLACVSDASLAGDCPALELLPNNPTLLRMRFVYTWGFSNVHFEVEIDVRDKETGEVIQSFPGKVFDGLPGFEVTRFAESEMSFPLLPAGSPERVLVIRYRATDNDGKEIVRASRTIPILDRANTLEVDTDTMDAQLRRRGFPGYLVVGETPNIGVTVSHLVGTKGIVGWRSRIVNARAIDVQGATLAGFLFELSVIKNDVATGFYRSGLDTGSPTPVPAGAKEFVFDVVLENPEHPDRKVHSVEVRIPVREAGAAVEKSIPAGASVKTFDPIPAKLEVSANPNDQLVAMQVLLAPMFEDEGFFELDHVSPRSRARAVARTSEVPTLIPLNRHYSIYGTVADAGLSAKVTLGYDPEEDFPDDPAFDPDSLVIAVLNPNSGRPEALPSVHNKAQHTVTADYDGFYGLWTIASDTTVPAAACADPNADGNTTATDALFALRASVGSTVCAPCICDVNKNGSVTSSDALLILRFAVGQGAEPTCLECDD